VDPVLFMFWPAPATAITAVHYHTSYVATYAELCFYLQSTLTLLMLSTSHTTLGVADIVALTWNAVLVSATCILCYDISQVSCTLTRWAERQYTYCCYQRKSL